jgi:hypothetical protein
MKLSMHHFVHHKTHVDWPGIEPGLPLWKALSYWPESSLKRKKVREEGEEEQHSGGVVRDDWSVFTKGKRKISCCEMSQVVPSEPSGNGTCDARWSIGKRSSWVDGESTAWWSMQQGTEIENLGWIVCFEGCIITKFVGSVVRTALQLVVAVVRWWVSQSVDRVMLYGCTSNDDVPASSCGVSIWVSFAFPLSWGLTLKGLEVLFYAALLYFGKRIVFPRFPGFPHLFIDRVLTSSPYRAVNTHRLGYKNHSVNAV